MRMGSQLMTINVLCKCGHAKRDHIDHIHMRCEYSYYLDCMCNCYQQDNLVYLEQLDEQRDNA